MVASKFAPPLVKLNLRRRQKSGRRQMGERRLKVAEHVWRVLEASGVSGSGELLKSPGLFHARWPSAETVWSRSGFSSSSSLEITSFSCRPPAFSFRCSFLPLPLMSILTPPMETRRVERKSPGAAHPGRPTRSTDSWAGGAPPLRLSFL